MVNNQALIAQQHQLVGNSIATICEADEAGTVQGERDRFQLAMQLAVPVFRCHIQVIGLVIVLIAVKMVYAFIFGQGPAQGFRRNKYMFSQVSSLCGIRMVRPDDISVFAHADLAAFPSMVERSILVALCGCSRPDAIVAHKPPDLLLRDPEMRSNLFLGQLMPMVEFLKLFLSGKKVSLFAARFRKLCTLRAVTPVAFVAAKPRGLLRADESSSADGTGDLGCFNAARLPADSAAGSLFAIARLEGFAAYGACLHGNINLPTLHYISIARKKQMAIKGVGA